MKYYIYCFFATNKHIKIFLFFSFSILAGDGLEVVQN